MLPNLIFTVIAEEDEGVYRCIATNDDGSMTSNNATMTVFGEYKWAKVKTYWLLCIKVSGNILIDQLITIMQPLDRVLCHKNVQKPLEHRRPHILKQLSKTKGDSCDF